MRPAGRAAAAATILDRILAGEPAEKALTAWGRASRFAGSGDRNAIRDLVFQALRQRRSLAALGGGLTGQGLMLGLARTTGAEAEWCDGSPHGLPAPRPDAAPWVPQGAEALDVPDWLEPQLQQALGPDYVAVMQAMQGRAPVTLRVNAARSSREAAAARLAAEGIETVPSPLAAFALEVTEGARKVQTSDAYAAGLVELQDAASQAVVEALPLRDGMTVLDYCAGGGGKTLAMAARADLRLFAHDAIPRRMVDIPARMDRAGAQIVMTDNPARTGPYDLILTDVPCSGSGSWRRDPEGKWALTPERLAALCAIQSSILDSVAPMVAPGGRLAYATCSFLRAEDEDQSSAFLARHPGWRLEDSRRFGPLQGGDGFYLAMLIRP